MRLRELLVMMLLVAACSAGGALDGGTGGGGGGGAAGGGAAGGSGGGGQEVCFDAGANGLECPGTGSCGVPPVPAACTAGTECHYWQLGGCIVNALVRCEQTADAGTQWSCYL